MEAAGWGGVQTKPRDQLTDQAWFEGYFPASHDRWDGQTWVRNLHELRLRDLALFALGDVKGKRILDIGCGSGEYLTVLAKLGAQVAGQDLSVEAVNNAAERFRQEGTTVDVRAGDVTHRLLFDDGFFDGVFSADFFEHITHEQKQRVIAEAYRVLKPGGVLVIKTPHLDYLKLSIMVKRALAVLRFRSPWAIHIAHTRNNPDTQHCGLTTYAELEGLLLERMFHTPSIVFAPLVRKRLPRAISWWLYGKKPFTEQIIMSARKPLFYGFWP